MADQERQAEHAIVVYQGSPLETIGTRSLVLPEGYKRSPRFFIPEDIVVSRYGITGFLMVDNRPEQRHVTYTDPEWTGIHIDEHTPSLWDRRSDPHFYETDKGFKMIRYFMLPPNVGEFFATDKYLNEAMIDKMCRQDTLPEEFDEEPARPEYAFGSGFDTVSSTEEAGDIVSAIIKTSMSQLNEEQLQQYTRNRKNQYAYVSFHPWLDFKYVIGEGQRSIFTAMSNFDGLISRFDVRRVLPARDLQLTGGDVPQLQEPETK